MCLLRNAVYEACRQASLSVCLEAGGGLGKDKALTRPADVLVSNPSGSASLPLTSRMHGFPIIARVNRLMKCIAVYRKIRDRAKHLFIT